MQVNKGPKRYALLVMNSMLGHPHLCRNCSWDCGTQTEQESRGLWRPPGRWICLLGQYEQNSILKWNCCWQEPTLSAARATQQPVCRHNQPQGAPCSAQHPRVAGAAQEPSTQAEGSTLCQDPKRVSKVKAILDTFMFMWTDFFKKLLGYFVLFFLLGLYLSAKK